MWLLDSETSERLRLAYDVDPARLEASPLNLKMMAAAPEISTMRNGTATIKLSGVLTDSRDFWAIVFGLGNTVYSDFAAALRSADSDPRVSQIDILFDSPGGTASAAWRDTMAAVAETEKPTRGIITRALSAAYGIASQCDSLVAVNDMATVGSVGVAMTALVSDYRVDVTSSNAPKKRPDASTPEGRAMIREQLDAIEAQFIEIIAAGRGTEERDVRENYGRGATLTAREGLSRGMIDSIGGTTRAQVGDGGDDMDDNDDESRASIDPTPKNAVESASNDEGLEIMDLNTLRNSHPAVFAEAVQIGVDRERKRCTDHIKRGVAVGDVSIASEAIESGKSYADSQVDYDIAKDKKTAKDNRAAGDDALADAADGAGGKDAAGVGGGKSFEDQIVDRVESLMGIDTEGGAK